MAIKEYSTGRELKLRMWRKIFVLFFFLERITALEAPVDLATVDISTHSLSVMWRNLDGEANWFKATISPLDEGETTQGVKYINESVVTWVDLVPGKNYTISVVAISGNGRISLATQIVASTKPMPPYRVRLSKFANRALSAHSFGTGRLMMFPVYGAVVYWDGPDSGHFDGYELTVNPPHGVVRYTRGEKTTDKG
nr:uncharacterized protein LOC113474268 [Ciona intestinalis]|eukprot:XP_026690446.1 uncharacterized protein LOC113474268 [Ciona intestinalis]